MEVLTLRNWMFGPFAEVQAYLLTVAALLKLLKLQNGQPMYPYSIHASNISIEAVGARKRLMFSVSEIVDEWITKKAPRRQFSALEIGVSEEKPPVSELSADATSIDEQLCRAMIVCYREKSKPILKSLFPIATPEMMFLANVRDSFAHSGSIRGPAQKRGSWRGIDFSELEDGARIYPTIISSGDIILLLHDIDEQVGSRWDGLTQEQKLEWIDKLAI